MQSHFRIYRVARSYDGQMGQSKDAVAVCDNIILALLLDDPAIDSWNQQWMSLLSVRSLSVEHLARLALRVAQSFAQIVRVR